MAFGIVEQSPLGEQVVTMADEQGLGDKPLLFHSEKRAKAYLMAVKDSLPRTGNAYSVKPVYMQAPVVSPIFQSWVY